MFIINIVKQLNNPITNPPPEIAGISKINKIYKNNLFLKALLYLIKRLANKAEKEKGII